MQETWLRLSRADSSEITNLGAWLTTVTSRISLDMLRARTSRREDAAGLRPEGELGGSAPEGDPEEEALLAELVGAALLVILDTLTPAERLAFVLHDMFALPFDEIGVIVTRSPEAAKQLASRARRKVQGSQPPANADPTYGNGSSSMRSWRRRATAGSRTSSPCSIRRWCSSPIRRAVQMGSPATIVGSRAVAATFSGRAQAAQPALIDGAVGMVWMVDGRTKVAWDFTIAEGRITHIAMLAAPATLAELEVTVLE